MRSAADSHERVVDPDDLLASREVRAACGGWSDMTLWRHTHHHDLEIAFPGPDVVLNGRKYWRRRTVEAWRTRQAERTKARASLKPSGTKSPSTMPVAPQRATPASTEIQAGKSEHPNDKRRRFKTQQDVSHEP
jgi:hypothetical protein